MSTRRYEPKVVATFKKISKGSSTYPVYSGTVGEHQLELYVNPTLVDGAKNYNIVAESYLAPATTGAFATQGSGLYTIRGVAGVATSKTFKGTANQGYITGIQAKLDNKGIIGDNNSGGIYACAGLSQVSGAGTYGTDAQLYGHWIDFQAGMGALPTTTHMLNMTNNSGQTIANGIFMYGASGEITNVLNLNTMGGSVVTATGVSTISKGIRIKIDSTTYYIPCCTGTT